MRSPRGRVEPPARRLVRLAPLAPVGVDGLALREQLGTLPLKVGDRIVQRLRTKPGLLVDLLPLGRDCGDAAPPQRLDRLRGVVAPRDGATKLVSLLVLDRPGHG